MPTPLNEPESRAHGGSAGAFEEADTRAESAATSLGKPASELVVDPSSGVEWHTPRGLFVSRPLA